MSKQIINLRFQCLTSLDYIWVFIKEYSITCVIILSNSNHIFCLCYTFLIITITITITITIIIIIIIIVLSRLILSPTRNMAVEYFTSVGMQVCG